MGGLVEGEWIADRGGGSPVCCGHGDFFRAALGRFLFGFDPGQPAVEVGPRLDRHPTLHLVVAPAADLGTDDVISARLGRLEPHRYLHARDGILLHAEVRQKEAVENVHALELNKEIFVNRHMEVVDDEQVVFGAERFVAARVTEPPFELTGHDLHRGGHPGPAHLHVGPGVHLVDGEEEHRRRGDDRPHHLEGMAPVDVGGRLRGSCGVILPHEPKQDQFGRKEDDAGEHKNEIEEAVDRLAVNRDVLREPVVVVRRDHEGGSTEDRDKEEQQAPGNPAPAAALGQAVGPGIARGLSRRRPA